MEPVPLFTQAEFATAFALLLPDQLAADVACRWFEMFAGDDMVDGDGRYLYVDWWDLLGAGDAAALGADTGFATGPEVDWDTSYDWLLSLSHADLEDYLLRFSDFHLDLVALCSPDLWRRVERTRLNDPAGAMDRRCGAMRKTLAKMRRG